MQHDETLLPRMLEVLRAGAAEVVVGSRYLRTDRVPGWDERRHLISRLATRLGKAVLKFELTDPMSGFFAMRRDAFERTMRGVSGIGFEILLDLLASARPPLRVCELPYRFRSREVGESKLDTRVAVDFGLLLLDKLVGRVVPARFILFAAVGALGVLVHLAVLELVFGVLVQGFVAGQAAATLVAMTFNFALNNELTYSDRRLRGRRWVRGWLAFVLVCGLGAVANVGVAGRLYDDATPWLQSALAGIAVGVVWNYVATSLFVWKRGNLGRPLHPRWDRRSHVGGRPRPARRPPPLRHGRRPRLPTQGGSADPHPVEQAHRPVGAPPGHPRHGLLVRSDETNPGGQGGVERADGGDGALGGPALGGAVAETEALAHGSRQQVRRHGLVPAGRA